MKIQPNPHTPENKLAQANQLRRQAFLRREQSKVKTGAEKSRLHNEAIELENQAADLEADIRRMNNA